MDLQTPTGAVRHPLSGLGPDAGTPRGDESERRPPPDFVDFKEPDVKDIREPGYRDRPDVVDIVDIRDVRDRPDVVDIVDINDIGDRPDVVDVVDIIERPQR
jgi:hypothetical protein